MLEKKKKKNCGPRNEQKESSQSSHTSGQYGFKKTALNWTCLKNACLVWDGDLWNIITTFQSKVYAGVNNLKNFF